MLRLSKKQKFGLATTALILLMAATIPLAIWVTHTSSAQLENSRRKCDRQEHVTHTVVIANGTVSPGHTEARLCDQLTITNKDRVDRLIAFGKHDNHISYDGISERVLGQNQSLTITLIKDGTYLFHDHAHDEVHGTFTVAP